MLLDCASATKRDLTARGCACKFSQLFSTEKAALHAALHNLHVSTGLHPYRRRYDGTRRSLCLSKTSVFNTIHRLWNCSFSCTVAGRLFYLFRGRKEESILLAGVSVRSGVVWFFQKDGSAFLRSHTIRRLCDGEVHQGLSDGGMWSGCG